VQCSSMVQLYDTFWLNVGPFVGNEKWLKQTTLLGSSEGHRRCLLTSWEHGHLLPTRKHFLQLGWRHLYIMLHFHFISCLLFGFSGRRENVLSMKNGFMVVNSSSSSSSNVILLHDILWAKLRLPLFSSCPATFLFKDFGADSTTRG